MIALGQRHRRTHRHDQWLGGMTAGVAGLVNVCCVMAFFAFASNVTGHVAVFIEELVKGHWHQVGVVGAWFGLFVLGAFHAHFCVASLDERAPLTGRAIPLLTVMLVLATVGFYGDIHYAETLSETERLVGLLLLSMGTLNGLVATVSGGSVKTTHLTGLSTDLGMELSMLVRGALRRNPTARQKLVLHVLVLTSYVLGGAVGGGLFLQVGFQAFYLGSAALGLVLVHDLVAAYTELASGLEPPVTPAEAHTQGTRSGSRG